MQIEINSKDIEILAQLVFIGELIINDEREQECKVLDEYRVIKEQIISAYKSTFE